MIPTGGANTKAVQPSASQVLGFQAERKIIEQDSAERLLLKSPTELGFGPAAAPVYDY